MKYSNIAKNVMLAATLYTSINGAELQKVSRIAILGSTNHGSYQIEKMPEDIQKELKGKTILNKYTKDDDTFIRTQDGGGNQEYFKLPDAASTPSSTGTTVENKVSDVKANPISRKLVSAYVRSVQRYSSMPAGSKKDSVKTRLTGTYNSISNLVDGEFQEKLDRAHATLDSKIIPSSDDEEKQNFWKEHFGFDTWQKGAKTIVAGVVGYKLLDSLFGGSGGNSGSSNVNTPTVPLPGEQPANAGKGFGGFTNGSNDHNDSNQGPAHDL